MRSRFSRLFRSSSVTHNDSRFGVVYDDIALSISPLAHRDVWAVEGNATLLADKYAERSAVRLHFDARLPGVASLADATQSAAQCKDGNGIPYWRFTLPEWAIHGWSEVKLRLQFEWHAKLAVEDSNSAVGPTRVPPLCLVIPSMLPRLVSEATPIPMPPPKLPVIRYDTELPQELDGGGIALADQNHDPGTDLLQTVIFVRPEFHADAAKAGVAEGHGVRLTDDAMKVVLDRAGAMLEFIGDEYGFRPHVRPVVFLTDWEFPLIDIPNGAFAPMKPEWIGARDPSLGKDQSVIRLLAQAWLGGGVRVWGENSVSLTLAIGGALGLRWYQQNDRLVHLEKTLAWQDRDLARAITANLWTEHEETLSIQLPLFHAMQDGRLQRALGTLLRQYWGRFLPQKVLIDLLRRFGVALPRVFY